MSGELVKAAPVAMASVEEVKARVQLVKQAMTAIMKDGTHYGKIPGCGDKPTLLQPGADTICTQFGLSPHFEVQTGDLGNGHREYISTCTLTKRDTGEVWAEGMGSCSTMESKYRYRTVSDYEDTGQPIPQDAKAKKAWYRKQGLGMKKVDGQWLWVRFKDGQKQENPDIADTWNTVLKMSNKRAYIAATIKATGCSDMFTQDIEDMPDMFRAEVPADDVRQQPAYADPTPIKHIFEPFAMAAHPEIEDKKARYAAAQGDILAEVKGTDMHMLTESQVRRAVSYMEEAIAAANRAQEAEQPQEAPEAVAADAYEYEEEF